MTLEQLAARLGVVLLEGGPRKPRILKALVKHWGETGAAFERVVAHMLRLGSLRILYRYGGPHYALRLDSRAKVPFGNGLRTRDALYTIARSRSKTARSKNKNKGAA
jgi:hypothetical protein